MSSHEIDYVGVQGQTGTETYLRESPTIYEIRALDTVSDLVASFRLRYDTYRGLGYLVCPLKSQLEIDHHDRYAIPFGAFDTMSGVLVGTLRVIGEQFQSGYDGTLRRIVDDFGDGQLAARIMPPICRRLPSVLTERIARCVDDDNTQRSRVFELSRVITRPDHRGSGLSRALIEFGIAHVLHQGPVYLIGGCLPEHVPMYARYGFKQLPGTDVDHFDHVNQRANVMVSRADTWPEPTSTHIQQLLHCMKSGAPGHLRDLGRGSQVFLRVRRFDVDVVA